MLRFNGLNESVELATRLVRKIHCLLCGLSQIRIEVQNVLKPFNRFVTRRVGKDKKANVLALFVRCCTKKQENLNAAVSVHAWQEVRVRRSEVRPEEETRLHPDL